MFLLRSTAMAFSERDKRALQVGAAALALWVVLRLLALPAWDGWRQERTELPLRETALIKYRQALASIGSSQQAGESLQARLRETELGLLQASSPALASAEFQNWVRQLAANHSIELRSSQFLPMRPQPAGYSLLPLGVQFQCRLDQLAGFMADLSSGPKVVAIPQLRIQSTNNEAERTVSVNLTITGVIRSQESSSSP